MRVSASASEKLIRRYCGLASSDLKDWRIERQVEEHGVDRSVVERLGGVPRGKVEQGGVVVVDARGGENFFAYCAVAAIGWSERDTLSRELCQIGDRLSCRIE